MVYRVMGVWSYEDKTFIIFSELLGDSGTWTHKIIAEKEIRRQEITLASTLKKFVEEYGLNFKVNFIVLAAQPEFNDATVASVAAETGLAVISGLPAIDMALGGNGEFVSFMNAKLGLGPDRPDGFSIALCVALMGVLRWREEDNFLSSVTGATRNSIGGALWIGQEI